MFAVFTSPIEMRDCSDRLDLFEGHPAIVCCVRDDYDVSVHELFPFALRDWSVVVIYDKSV